MVRVIRANEILQAEARGTTSTTPASGNGGAGGAGGNGGNGGNSGTGGNGGNGGNGGYDPCKDVSSQTVRFATIVAHLYRSLLEKEEEASVAVDMFYVLEIVGLFVGREFYALALPELLSVIDTALKYNVRQRARAET